MKWGLVPASEPDALSSATVTGAGRRVSAEGRAATERKTGEGVIWRRVSANARMPQTCAGVYHRHAPRDTCGRVACVYRAFEVRGEI